MKSIQIEGLDSKEFFTKLNQLLICKMNEVRAENPPTRPYQWLTVTETSTMLKISPRSLYNWTKAGILQSYSIGNRKYYRSDEVEQALKPNHNRK